MTALEDALVEFGIPYEPDGFFFRDPKSDRYIGVLDEVEYAGSDTAAVLMERHYTTLELYDEGGKSALEARCNLSRILNSHGLKHRRQPSDYLSNIKKAVTVYDLDAWIEKGNLYD